MERRRASAGMSRNTSKSSYKKRRMKIVESTKKTHKAFCLQFTWLESQVDGAHTQKKSENKKLSLLVHEFISLHLFFIAKCHWGDKDAAKSQSCHAWRLFSLPTTENWLWATRRMMDTWDSLQSISVNCSSDVKFIVVVVIVKFSVWPVAQPLTTNKPSNILTN